MVLMLFSVCFRLPTFFRSHRMYVCVLQLGIYSGGSSGDTTSLFQSNYAY